MEIREVDEAIHAGLRLNDLLESAEANLNAGKKWGIWDIFGGGTMSSWSKHAYINEAQKYLELATKQLNVFKKELRDVTINIEYSVNFDTFTQVADIIFDGMIVDIAVQSEIKNSIKNIRSTIKSVNDVLDQLYGMKKELEGRTDGGN